MAAWTRTLSSRAATFFLSLFARAGAVRGTRCRQSSVLAAALNQAFCVPFPVNHCSSIFGEVSKALIRGQGQPLAFVTAIGELTFGY